MIVRISTEILEAYLLRCMVILNRTKAVSNDFVFVSYCVNWCVWPPWRKCFNKDQNSRDTQITEVTSGIEIIVILKEKFYFMRIYSVPFFSICLLFFCWWWCWCCCWWWTGKPGMLQSMGSQSWTWLSDWTELNIRLH